VKVCLAQLPDALAFAERALDLKFPGGTTWVASRFDDGELAGVFIFTPMHKGDSSLHVAKAAPGWLTDAFLRACFSHAFLTLGCTRLGGTVLTTNYPSLSIAKRMGFRELCTLRGYTIGDLVLFEMLKGECKWVV